MGTYMMAGLSIGIPVLSQVSIYITTTNRREFVKYPRVAMFCSSFLFLHFFLFRWVRSQLSV